MKKLTLSLLIALFYVSPLKEEHIYIPRDIVVEDTVNRPIKEEIVKTPVVITGYDNDYECTQSGKGITASGKVASRGTLAAPSSIPFYTTVYINGVKHTVYDRGGAINIKNGVYHFDLWFATHKEAMKFGVHKGYMYWKDNQLYIEMEG